MIDPKSIKRVHFVGIGGIGISYLAHFFLRQGAVVSGSDVAQTPASDQLAARGASVQLGHDAALVTPDVQLVVYSEAVGVENPERQRAKELGITQLRQFELVDAIAKDRFLIAVAGNKGKTTTTAMLATMLERAGCDPMAMIGSFVNEWVCNFRHGESPFLVVEADEYKEKFLDLHPKVIVLTNLAADHLDYFGTEERVIEAFQTFIDRLPNDGLLVVNRDDDMTKKLKWPNCQVITFGMETTADLIAQNRKTVRSRQDVDISFQGKSLGTWSVPLPGKHNVYNALAALAVALSLGVPPEKLREALAGFKGTWRRFQVLGVYKFATVISDYAHHPAAVHATIEAAQDFYAPRRIVAVFQAHTRHRTKALFDDFVRCFDEADVVVVPDIFEVAGRETLTEQEMNAQMLVQSVRERDAKHGRKREVIASGNLQQTKDVIDATLKKDDVLLMMGAGDIYKLAEELG